MIASTGMRPRLIWGIALSAAAIALGVFGWFCVWAAGEYHARGGATASLGFLYLPEYARQERSVFGQIEMSLRTRGLYSGGAAIPVSLAAIVLCARSGLRAIALASLGFAIVLFPVAYFLMRLFW